MQVLLSFLFLISGIYAVANGQILRLGSKIDGSGNLMMVDTIFHLASVPQTIYAKMFSKTPIHEDTLVIIVKNLRLTHKFLLKRSTNKMEASGTIKVKEDGIYKAFVVNPKTKQTILSKKFYVTSAVNPNIQALKIDYQKQLAAQSKNKTQITSQNHTQKQPTKPSSPPKTNSNDDPLSDLEDIDNDLDITGEDGTNIDNIQDDIDEIDDID